MTYIEANFWLFCTKIGCGYSEKRTKSSGMIGCKRKIGRKSADRGDHPSAAQRHLQAGGCILVILSGAQRSRTFAPGSRRTLCVAAAQFDKLRMTGLKSAAGGISKCAILRGRGCGAADAKNTFSAVNMLRAVARSDSRVTFGGKSHQNQWGTWYG